MRVNCCVGGQVNEPTSVVDVEQAKISLAPNPATDDVRVSVTGGKGGGWYLYDAMGAVLSNDVWWGTSLLSLKCRCCQRAFTALWL